MSDYGLRHRLVSYASQVIAPDPSGLVRQVLEWTRRAPRPLRRILWGVEDLDRRGAPPDTSAHRRRP